MCGIYLYAAAASAPTSAPPDMAQRRILAPVQSLHDANPCVAPSPHSAPL